MCSNFGTMKLVEVYDEGDRKRRPTLQNIWHQKYFILYTEDLIPHHSRFPFTVNGFFGQHTCKNMRMCIIVEITCHINMSKHPNVKSTYQLLQEVENFKYLKLKTYNYRKTIYQQCILIQPITYWKTSL